MNEKKLLDHSRNIVQHYEAHPKLIESSPANYLAFCGNLMNALFNGKEDEELTEYSKKYLKLPSHLALKRLPRTNGTIFQRAYVLLLNMHLIDGDFDKALEHIPAIEKGMKSHKKFILEGHKTNLQTLVALVYFSIGADDKALDWSNMVLARKTKDIIEDFYYANNILQLII
ncbi:MAG: hypothetical protein GY810_28080 [Aureispira sp.]|nr:hypothetical protein [Aureispira sp.]